MSDCTRRQAAKILGITECAMKDTIFAYRDLGWPVAVRKEKNTQYHNIQDVIDWYERVKAHKLANSVVNIERKNGLDNALVTEFLRRPLIEDELIDVAAPHPRKQCDRGMYFYKEHLEERNDYERPHSGLSKQYNGANEHSVNLGGNW